ncbi:Transposase [Bacillus mycoides]|nr:Transposase [Bacillus mycoides]
MSGVEAMHMMKKGQLHRQVKSIQDEVEFVHNLFGITS